MYDTDEEIQRKRRNLFIIIGVVVLLIVILIIFLLTRNMGKKKTSKPTATEIGCSLEVKDGITPDSNGIYHQEIVVGYKSIDAISQNYQIVKQTIGTVDNSRNKETFTITKSGNYHLYGYVQDSAGHKGKCEISLKVNMSAPTCELEVTQGTLGDNGWYRSEVEVGFKSMDSNNPSVGIKQYYIDKEVTDLDDSQTVKADPPQGNVAKYTVKENLTTTLVGHVIDSSGNEGTCKLTVSKDATIPTCTLKVNSGTKNASGVYTDNPEIGFASAADDVSQIAAYGIGTSKNYTQKTYKVTGEGKTTVVGYVKDKAGNEGTCSLEITRPGGGSTTPPGGGGGTQTSSPSCSISLKVPATDKNGVYSQSVTATLKYSTTNGATITDYGIAESQTYNKKTEIVISNNGSHRVYGIVKDSYGHTATCSTPSFVIDKGDLLASKVAIGDYVAYDAGTWNENRPTEQKTDGYYWGMKNGQSRQKGVKCDTNDTGTRNGWMVLNVSNGQVVLISAGTPECIYHDRTSPSTVINSMQNEAKKYINTNYAAGSTILSCNLAGFDCNRSSYSHTLFVTGTHYWIAQSSSNNTLNCVTPRGTKESYSLKSLGLRPVIILRADVKTTGKQNNAWVLK